MRKKFHTLKRIHLRQSWNKYNLYNLSRAAPLRTTPRTLFQQKWSASSAGRTYHGERMQEQKWQRIFRGNIRSVVPMNHVYLAENDGSKEAAGRGSGLESTEDGPRTVQRTPYLSMVFAPLERRLDTAVFRALFASSIRQARQMVVHGRVRVNGKRIVHASYMLNPGDMFQVDPDAVMYATGVPKDSAERRAGRLLRAKASTTKQETRQEEGISSEVAQEPSASQASSPQDKPSDDQIAERKKHLRLLLDESSSLLHNNKISLGAKRKQELRAFQRTARKAISRPSSTLHTDLEAQLEEIDARIGRKDASQRPQGDTSPPVSMPDLQTPALREELQDLTPAQLHTLKEALIEAKENPIDHSKPYATPWQPRDYMSAFAFVPRYLEVHHKVCAAVYIRHPVARPGLAEVPSPYNNETLTLAHAWYLRRR